jgi:pyruvate dehydrogenase complex dehydrogenase (E1) component
MGLGPLTALYHARFNRYLHNRGIDDTSASRVWAFIGDGETDEPETLGSISLAAREKLDNLVFVVNCNLQRLDGPVRGNGKIIQELEAVFRGAGWNVIKVVWGSKWDELLAADVDGLLLNKMNSTVDGEFQRYSIEGGAYIREHFFGSDPRLLQLVAHLSDDELVNLPRGGPANPLSFWLRPSKDGPLGRKLKAATQRIKSRNSMLINCEPCVIVCTFKTRFQTPHLKVTYFPITAHLLTQLNINT